MPSAGRATRQKPWQGPPLIHDDTVARGRRVKRTPEAVYDLGRELFVTPFRPNRKVAPPPIHQVSIRTEVSGPVDVDSDSMPPAKVSRSRPGRMSTMPTPAEIRF